MANKAARGLTKRRVCAKGFWKVGKRAKGKGCQGGCPHHKYRNDAMKVGKGGK